MPVDSLFLLSTAQRRAVRVEEIGYLDFDLRIERAGAGLRASVLNSPAGQAASDFTLPFSDLELENFILRMSRSGRKTRRLGTPEFEAARAFGGRLFEALFTGEVRGCLRSSLDAAEREGRGLRIRLRLTDAPELADVPWEYLYSPALNRFFALSNTTPLVRYLDLPGRIAPLAVQPPLRLLAIIASPRDYPALDANGEWERLRSALKELENAGMLALERLEPPTLSALQRRLRADAVHILHFIGHGAFDEAAQDGLLVLEDQNGGGRVVSGQDLGVLLHDHHAMRLVVLNSCEGARTSLTQPFAGTAQSLVQQGMPAVLAMQFEISDQAAVVLSHEFYAALAAGYPVDAALSEARKAVFTDGSDAEWGTPVLYLRSSDGRVFGVAPPPQPAPRAAAAPVPMPAPAQAVETPRAPARGASSARRWLVALVGLALVLAVGFGAFRLLPGLSNRGTRPTVLATRSAPLTAAAASAPRVETPVAQAGAASIDKLIARQPSVLSSSIKVYGVVSAGDGVWAATSGGLARWKGDGTSRLYTAADGLPMTHQRAILPPQDGVLWLAGTGAAARVTIADDKVTAVEKYTAADGIYIGESPVIARDTDGSIWVASLYRDDPILRFDGALWRPPDLPTDDPALQGVRPQIASMLRARDGALWSGLWEDGILRLADGKWTRFGPDQGVPAEEVVGLLEDRRGALWAAGGKSGLLRFDPADEDWKRVEFQLANAEITSISELPDGRLWAADANFIFASEDGGNSWKTVAAPTDGLYYPRSAAQDNKGRIWMGSDQGVVLYENGEWRNLIRPGELAWYTVGAIEAAPDGKLWVLPEYDGPPSVVDPATGAAGPPDLPGALPNAVSLAFADGATWAGASDGLLRVKDGETETWNADDGLPGERVTVLLPAAGSLWIGGSEGLARLDLAKGNIVEKVDAVAGQFVNALALGADGALWAATYWGDNGEYSAIYRLGADGLQRWPNTGAPLGRLRMWANALAADEAGGMWVASDNGVYRWDGAKWITWTPAQGAPSGEVFAFLPHDGAMWMAGHSGTIDRWDAERGWRSFRPAGLTGDALAMRMSDDGSLWIGTADGLLRYSPQ